MSFPSAKTARGRFSGTANDYNVFGWRVRSALSLGEVLAWQGDDRAPDVAIDFGNVPTTIEGGVDHGPFLHVGADGTCQLNIRAVARFHITRHSVTIDPREEAAAEDINTFLFGSVMGILCHLRGLLPLHASAVDIDGRAVAFTGISGSGKSTLAASLVARGHRLLTDDVAAIDPAAPGGPILFPGFPRVKLWKDSLNTLGVDCRALPRARAAMDKFSMPAPSFDPKPVRLRAVYGLRRAQDSHPVTIDRTSGRDATATFSNNIYRGAVASLLGRQAGVFAGVIQLARSVPAWVLPRSNDLGTLDALALRVTEHAKAALS